MDKIEASRRLVNVFRQYGYEGATLSRISQATGLGKASLYHHFPNGKQEMAEAVLEYVSQWFGVAILEPLHRSGEPRKRIQAMNESLKQFYNCGRDACLLALFSLGDSNDLFHEQVNQMLNAWIDGLAQVLEEVGLSKTQARQRAEDAVIQVQGALVLTRGLNNTAPFERVLEQLPDQLLHNE
ncbi:TetR/AcrR family transcriptional regulator [Scytonema tolypothrichoides VB-61278]|nr:TetR/AcrR family transcriptional regulator [Scytonema tolypothrichoides VB-61278]